MNGLLAKLSDWQTSSGSQVNWLHLFVALELATILWIIASQLAIVSIQRQTGSVEAAASVICCALAAMCIIVGMRLRRPIAVLSTFAIEILLILFAGLLGSVSGYQLISLSAAAKSRFFLDKKRFFIVCATVFAINCLLSVVNPHLTVQGAYAFNLQEDLLSVIFGRDLATFAIGLILVIVLSEALQRERELRLEAERLTEKLAQLSAEFERNKIASDINASVDHMLVALVMQLDYAQQVRKQSSEAAQEGLLEAKELASGSLKEIRRALQMMRDVVI